jgi:ubiquinol-cytochrome c reductase cytochrome c1 subunit
MKKMLLGLMLALGLTGAAQAAGGGFALDKAPQRTNDMAALQNGAKLFVNYCLSCHSASFMRFNRLRDIGLTDKQIAENLAFTTDKIGDTMKASIDPKEAKAWFGANPPDLTLVARSRSSRAGTGADYVYTLLRTYYRDDTKPTGWNNLVFPNIGMPHPLWEMQGERKPSFEKHESHGQETLVFKAWEPSKAGAMSQDEYDHNVGDLVAYLQWMAEPAQNDRVRIGVWVLLFLSVFTVVAWRLNAAFWKDVK